MKFIPNQSVYSLSIKNFKDCLNMKTYIQFINESALKPGTKEIGIEDVYNIIKNNCTEFLDNPMNIFKGARLDLDHYYSFDPKVEYRTPLMSNWVYINRHHYEIAEQLENKNIKNYNNLISEIIKSIKEIKKETHSNVPFGQQPFDTKEIDKRRNDLEKIIKLSILDLANSFVNEGEWEVKNNPFNVPESSILFVKERYYEKNIVAFEKCPWKIEIIKYKPPTRNSMIDLTHKNALEIIKNKYAN